MDARTLLLRKQDVDTNLVRRQAADTDSDAGRSKTFSIGFRVLPGSKKRVRFDRRGTDDVAGSEWPASTDLLCWHCCHPFDGPPLPLPVAHDEKRDEFRVMGCFCSWACMKTYNGADASYLKHARASLITLFRKRATGMLGRLDNDRRLVGHVVAAPPRAMLKAFGGTMTIEEFRAASGEGKAYRFLPPKLVLHDHLVEERHVAATPKPAADLAASVTFAKSAQKNETLKLKRSKPLAAHNMLERTMGLQFE